MRFEMAPEQRKVIEWLRSPAGLRWSHRRHYNSSDQVDVWAGFKPDHEHLWKDDCDNDCDLFEDTITVDLGWYDENARYHREARGTCVMYGKALE